MHKEFSSNFRKKKTYREQGVSFSKSYLIIVTTLDLFKCLLPSKQKGLEIMIFENTLI